MWPARNWRTPLTARFRNLFVDDGFAGRNWCPDRHPSGPGSDTRKNAGQSAAISRFAGGRSEVVVLNRWRDLQNAPADNSANDGGDFTRCRSGVRISRTTPKDTLLKRSPAHVANFVRRPFTRGRCSAILRCTSYRRCEGLHRGAGSISGLHVHPRIGESGDIGWLRFSESSSACFRPKANYGPGQSRLRAPVECLRNDGYGRAGFS